jgi:hypothetical protein
MQTGISSRSIIVILLLSTSSLVLIQQVHVLPCPMRSPYAMCSQGVPSDADSIFANFTTLNINTFSGVAYPIMLVDVWDPENVTDVWADFKRSNESEWTTASMQRGPWRWNNSFQFTPSLLVSQTVTYFDVHFRANDTTGDVSTSQDFSLMITYSRPNTLPYDVVALNNLVKLIIVSAILLGSIAAIVVAARHLVRRTGVEQDSRAPQ